jgi:hypothetical protein
MKHASAATLSRVEPLLEQLRGMPGLTEKRPGVFYRRGAAFVHFHEDQTGIFADVRSGQDWERRPAAAIREQSELLRRVKEVLAARPIR